MRATPAKDLGPGEFRRLLGRLEALPIRPASARAILAGIPEDDGLAPPDAPGWSSPLPHSAEVDPGWALERCRSVGRASGPSEALVLRSWWLPSLDHEPGPILDALGRLWRHSVAVAFAARKLAREAGDPDPEALARAGLLHNLGIWAASAIRPGFLVEWLLAAPPARRALERARLGEEAAGLGRSLAERWGCDPLVVDSAWLHADLDADLGVASADPARLALVQRAFAIAEQTPWGLAREPGRDLGLVEPRARILTAEVQSRCPGPFVEADASAREERLTRDNARLRLALARSEAEQGSSARFLRAFAESSPAEGLEAWSTRAGLAWCAEPGIVAARVDGADADPEAEPEARAPSLVVPLGEADQPVALVRVWGEEGSSAAPIAGLARAAWDAWARVVADRSRLRKALDEVASAHRGRVAREASARQKAMLEALAEFAAGAGHELNNPLAVIVGRAQLLLAKAPDDPDATRSLRAIIAQAQKASRILRDLMYVARPPVPRPRPCQPDEIVRACLRDLQGEADARGVRIVAEARDPAPRVWADPDPLRQVADVLVRNALEATPSGGVVRFTSGGDADQIRWVVHDTGRGLAPGESTHLFDPFFCGRAAGRGLGLGLPRAARIVAQAGGELRWRSIPGQGSTFQVSLPVAEIPPAEPESDRPADPKAGRGPSLPDD